MKNSSLILPLIIILSLAGCMRRAMEPKRLDCPVPTFKCQPARWDGLAYDTSEINELVDYYYKFDKVKRINSPENDWSLSFIDKRKALFSFDDRDKQSVMIVRMIKHDKASTVSGVGIPIYGHIGSSSIQGNNIALAISPEEGMIGKSNIYMGKIEDNFVKDLKKMEALSVDKFFWESHPSLSNDGKVLFFASNRTGRKGDVDIWFSVKMDDEAWSEPINCGKMVNTLCSEITPFVSAKGDKLYFASCGHESVGGYDIFKSKISPKFWEAVEKKDINSLRYSGGFFSIAKNMRPPLNTKSDELFPSSPNDPDSLLYYCSNQDDDKASLVTMEGGFDLFVRIKYIREEDKIAKRKKLPDAELPEADVKLPEEKPKFDIPSTFTLEGKVTAKSTSEPIEGAIISVKEIPANKLSDQLRTGPKGEYSFKLEKEQEYQITAQTKELFYQSVSVYVESFDTVKNKTINFNLPKKMTLRINFPTDKYQNPYKYSLDSNGVATSYTWKDQLDLLAKNILLAKDSLKKMIIIGHTDDVGSISYNEKLGKRRVDFVIDELIKQGAPESLLEGRSEGETSPLPRREDESLRLYRERLRRVEIKKIWK